MHNNQGITYLEVTIMALLSVILVIIAIMGIQRGMIYAKVSGVKKDIRNIAKALEAYKVDHNEYPIPGNYSMGSWPFVVPAVLTSPVAYIPDIPNDIFSPTQWGEPLKYTRYASDAREFQFYGQWYIASNGPDLKWDYASKTYEPSNGIVSSGDIILRQNFYARYKNKW
jgi:general secretion pathway protein G